MTSARYPPTTFIVSLQVVEEAPSPFITPEVRKAMGEQAVLLSQAVNYQVSILTKLLL